MGTRKLCCICKNYREQGNVLRLGLGVLKRCDATTANWTAPRPPPPPPHKCTMTPMTYLQIMFLQTAKWLIGFLSLEPHVRPAIKRSVQTPGNLSVSFYGSGQT